MRWVYLVLAGVFVVALFAGAAFLTVQRVTPKTRIPDSAVLLVTPEYTDLPNDPVRGKLVITSPSLNDNTIRICAITDGAVFEGEDVTALTCDQSQKEVIVKNERAEVNLYSGSYFVDTASRHEGKNTFPFRINIHKGKQATLVLP